MKHTNLNLYQMERIRSINEDIKCFGGFENCMVAFLAFGCDGFIGSNFNFMLPQYKRIMELYLDNRGDEARKLQTKSNNILDVVLKNGLCASLKYIAALQGIEAGDVRKPMKPLDQAQKEEINQVLKQYLEII